MCIEFMSDLCFDNSKDKTEEVASNNALQVSIFEAFNFNLVDSLQSSV